ncbi:hypothetical protein Esti_001074 [Eimeria stiedai]
MREKAQACQASPQSFLQPAASGGGQYLHPSVAATLSKVARFQGGEAQCVLIPTAAALKVARACVKQYTLGGFDHLHKARITAARLCGHSGPLYGDKRQAVEPEAEATRRQRAASYARHCVARCLTACSGETLSRQAAHGSGVNAGHPSTDTSAINNEVLCTGHTDNPGIETQQAEAQEMCASSLILDALGTPHRSSFPCSLPDGSVPQKEAAQPSGDEDTTDSRNLLYLRTNIRKEEDVQKSTSDEGSSTEKQKWIDRYKRLELQCSELSKELHCIAPKIVLPRWQRQALDLASYSAYVHFEAVRKVAAQQQAVTVERGLRDRLIRKPCEKLRSFLQTLRSLTMDVAKIRTSVSLMRVQACEDKVELGHARTYISEAIAQLKGTLSEASLRLEQMQVSRPPAEPSTSLMIGVENTSRSTLFEFP